LCQPLPLLRNKNKSRPSFYNGISTYRRRQIILQKFASAAELPPLRSASNQSETSKKTTTTDDWSNAATTLPNYYTTDRQSVSSTPANNISGARMLCRPLPELIIGGSPFHIVRGPIHDAAAGDIGEGGGDIRRYSAPDAAFYYHKQAEISSHYETIPDWEYSEISNGWDNRSYAVLSPLSEHRHDCSHGHHDMTSSGLYHDMSGTHRHSSVGIQENGGVSNTVSYIPAVQLPPRSCVEDQVHVAHAQPLDRTSGIAPFHQIQHDSQLFIQQFLPLSSSVSNRLSQHEDNSRLRYLSDKQRIEQHGQLQDRRRSALMNSRSSRVSVSNPVTSL
jgi:hypothetical protein